MSDSCRSCGAAITWVKTSAGKTMPVDAEPVADGNLVIEDGVVRYLSSNQVAMFVPANKYKSHFATCPNASEHRKK